MTAFVVPLSESYGVAAEGVLGKVSAAPSLVETVSFVEAGGILLTFRPPMGETAVLAESGAVHRRARPPLAEPLAFVEQLRGGRPYAGAVSETVSLSEAVTGRFRASAALAEALPVAEGAGGDTAHSFTNVIFEGVAAIETVGSQSSARLTLLEGPALAEAVVLAGDYGEGLAETVDLVEVLRGGHRYTGTVSETVTLTEARTSVGRLRITLGETVLSSATVGPHRAFHAAVVESVSMVEALVGRAGARSGVGETVALSDAVGRASESNVSLTASVALAEAGASRLGAVAPRAEVVVIDEALFGRRRVAASLVEPAWTWTYSIGPRLDLVQVPLRESYSLRETLTTRAVMGSGLGETVAVAEATGNKKRVPIVFAVPVAFSGQLGSAQDALSALLETVASAESGSARLRGRPALPETVASTEALATEGVFAHRFDEAYALGESVVALRDVTDAALAETVALSEGITAAKRGLIGLGQSITVADAVSAMRATRFAAREGFLIFDVLSGRQRALSNLAENVGEPSAAFAGGGKLSRIGLSEGTSLSEGIGLRILAAVQLAETPAHSQAISVSLGDEFQFLDEVALSDLQTSVFRGRTTFAESLGLTEGIAVRKRSVATLPLHVGVTELLGP